MGKSTMVLTAHALFDPQYLPPKLLHREHELDTLTQLLTSEDETYTNLNIMVHGSFGIGRTTLLRFLGHHEFNHCHRPFINFHGKNTTEIIIDTLSTLRNESNITGSIPELWTHVKRLVRKVETPIIFIFDDVDRQNSEIYGKFLQLCKEQGVSSMATAPRYYPRQLTNNTGQLLDFTLELEPFTDNQLLDIIKQRVAATFPFSFSSTITELMADIIGILDFQRPATAVELLRHLYPLTLQQTHITANQIRQACLNSRTLHYDFWSEHLSGLADLDATTTLLLQAIGEYFSSNPSLVYVSRPQLFVQYQQVCETIGLHPTTAQFSRALNILLFQDLLLRSRYNTQNYFTLIPAEGYLEIVDLLIGEHFEEC